MRDALNHLVPGVIFGGAGVALIWYVVRSVSQWKRTGSLRVSISPRWTPLGGWAPLESLLRSWGSDRDEPAKTREIRTPWAASSFLSVCVLVAVVLLVTGYDYLRFGHGL